MPARNVKSSKKGGKEGNARKAKTNVSKRKAGPMATRPDVPQFFRMNVEVGDLDAAIDFYRKLLGVQGRKQDGSRCYFECGTVTLQVLDVSSARSPHPGAKALYFTVKNLEAAFERAAALGCLSRESVHDAPGGGIVVRPWGERSFYAEDPWKNPLCFVEEGTVYTG